MTHPILSGPLVEKPKSPLDEFDPNKRDKGAPPWATYCPSRSPSFKTHTQRGHAIGALNNHGRYWGGGILFSFESGQWVEAARFEVSGFAKPRCDNCNTSLMTKPEEKYNYQAHKYESTGRMLNAGVQVFVRVKGKIADPPTVVTVCTVCRQSLGY